MTTHPSQTNTETPVISLLNYEIIFLNDISKLT